MRTWLVLVLALALFVVCSCGNTPPVHPQITTTVVIKVMVPLAQQIQDKPLVYDENGVLQTWAWLQEAFGFVQVAKTTDPSGVHVTELQAITGPSTLVVYVRSPSGEPVTGVVVVRSWPGAPQLSDPNMAACGIAQGVWGLTKEDGSVGFGMGYGDYYDPTTEVGASTVWLAYMPSDCISGLGMIALTNHRHLDVLYVLP